jgi:predicted aldo/keto reductase-like oxidoreductase
MQSAVSACSRAGIGLTAMKTQADSVWFDVGRESETALQLTEKFMQSGYTPAQAKLKAVWEDTRIASICSQMPSMTILSANKAAAVGRKSLSRREKNLLERYARETDRFYCAGCTRVCENAVGEKIAIGVVMRCLMYARSYHDLERAKAEFYKLPEEMRAGLNRANFTEAERQCPNRLPISSLMQEAVSELA